MPEPQADETGLLGWYDTNSYNPQIVHKPQIVDLQDANISGATWNDGHDA